MIPAWLIRFGLRHWLKIAGAAAIASAVCWVYYTGYDRGYAAHRAEVQAATADRNDELERMKKKHRAAVEAYLSSRSEAQKLREKLDAKAREDPDADRRALSARSVRRLRRAD